MTTPLPSTNGTTKTATGSRPMPPEARRAVERINNTPKAQWTSQMWRDFIDAGGIQ